MGWRGCWRAAHCSSRANISDVPARQELSRQFSLAATVALGNVTRGRVVRRRRAVAIAFVVSAVFTAMASLLAAPTAWPMWLLFVCVTAATLVFFVGFLRQEFDYKVR